jgi:hypothetical protein
MAKQIGCCRLQGVLKNHTGVHQLADALLKVNLNCYGVTKS